MGGAWFDMKPHFWNTIGMNLYLLTDDVGEASPNKDDSDFSQRFHHGRLQILLGKANYSING